MKKVMLSVAIIATIGLVSCKNETKKETTKTEQTTANKLASTETTFGVRGNCGMCKSTIEKAANSIQGVSKAIWDVDKKKIDVSFDASKTNVEAIHNAISASGYDTDKVMGNESAYENLPACCKYDHQMKMGLN
ncbi:heavy-metal-associated domain-containing protein [Tenacibaculum sp. M341]|uniref:heavy-metal-associated domain-containing protein n=1 Tax=Tenacibaculum sp. M341 TaxID=2530339 RepID=UPI0010437F50|nr:cation transporter [Tenacibaculum sp. M341]TCI91478.1 copper chaperone [Tenacibaculum sp. M341]